MQLDSVIPRIASTPIKAPPSPKLQRFRARVTELLARKLWLKPEVATEPPAPFAHPDPLQPAPTLAPVAPVAIVEAKLPPVERTDARTFEGSARSSDGATSPWLLLPPERAYRLYVPPRLNDGEPLHWW